MKNKTYLKVLIIFILSFISIHFIMNVTVFASNSKQKIYDLAGLLNSQEIQKLEDMSNKYGAKRETDIVILTINDTKGKDVVKYMEDFYDEKALGYDKPHGNCAILTIDMQHREVYLAGFYLAKERLDDSRLELIRNKITSDLSDKNYYKAFESFIKTSYKYMGVKPGTDPDNILFSLWFQIIVSLVAAVIVVSVMANNSDGKVTVNEGTYEDFKTSKIVGRRDDYIRTSITKVKKPSSNNENSSSSSSSGDGVSDGGHSHSGSRGSF